VILKIALTAIIIVQFQKVPIPKGRRVSKAQFLKEGMTLNWDF